MALPIKVVSKDFCFQCINPKEWTNIAITMGLLNVCEEHAAVLVAAMHIKNNQIKG